MPRNILQLIAPGRARQLGAAESAFIYVLAAVTCSVAIAVGFGVYINGMILMYAFLGIVLAVSFLTLTGNPLRPQKASWFGWIAAALSLAIAIYFMIRDPYYETRLPMIDALSLTDQAAGVWGSHQPVSFYEFYKVLAQNGGEFLDADGTAVAFNTPAGIEAAEWLVGKSGTILIPASVPLPSLDGRRSAA